MTIDQSNSQAVRVGPPQIRVPDRLILCGGAYSDNLGDAVIADCLVYALGRHLPQTQIVKMDISGRVESRRVGFGPKGRIQAVMNALPQALGGYLVLLGGSLYVKRTVEPTWQHLLEDHDTVIIGGGQLFQDEQLNFPLKMWWLTRNLRRSHARHVVYSVGVSSEWSKLGRMLFRPVFRGPELLYCSVRDRGSRRNLLAHLPETSRVDVQIDPDPALLAGFAYEAATRTVPKQFDIGIGIMHPRTVRIDARQRHMTPAMLSHRWRALIGALLDRDLRVALFTNGAREDEEYVQRLVDDLRGQPGLVVLPRPISATDLVINIARMRTVIAHRLHASIVGYALGTPTLGLLWDPKLEEFYSACERDRWIVDFSTTSTEQLVAKAGALLRVSVDPMQQDRLIDSCRAGVERLAAHATA
ncbi:MAG: polysaccharide pyruvyl transferase family protein [Chloroflexota bacterium]|nr:polysaccharide pyruvyl transferase family protein [Chloroflexota bacterium]